MLVSSAFNTFLFEARLGGQKDKTRRNYLTTLNSFITAVGDIPIELLALEHITRWKMFLDAQGKAHSTMSAYLCHLRGVLKFVASRNVKVMDYREVTLPRVKQNKPVYLEYGEVQMIIDATDNVRDKAIIALLFSTGCRISELLSINRGDILGNEVVVTGKGDKHRRVYIDPKAMKLLVAYMETRTGTRTPLFISGQYRRLTVSRVEQIIHQTTNAAGIEKNVTPHVFRHTFATDLLRNGANIRAIQNMLGHSNLNTTMRYTHVSDIDLEAAHKKYHSS